MKTTKHPLICAIPHNSSRRFLPLPIGRTWTRAGGTMPRSAAINVWSHSWINEAIAVRFGNDGLLLCVLGGRKPDVMYRD